MIQKVVGFLKEVRSELSQVSWDTPQELWGSTKVVLATVALLSLVVWIFDLGCAKFMSFLIR